LIHATLNFPLVVTCGAKPFFGLPAACRRPGTRLLAFHSYLPAEQFNTISHA